MADPLPTYILTAAEAATVLRCTETDEDMLALLPIVDGYLKNATGHDWAADSPINPTAKSAARILITLWHENPGMIGNSTISLDIGLRSVLVQLEALALRYKEFKGRDGVGPLELIGASIGDSVSSLTGIIGETGDQSSKFEEVITVKDEIQQVSESDLSDCYYRVYLLPLHEL